MLTVVSVQLNRFCCTPDRHPILTKNHLDSEFLIFDPDFKLQLLSSKIKTNKSNHLMILMNKNPNLLQILQERSHSKREYTFSVNAIRKVLHSFLLLHVITFLQGSCAYLPTPVMNILHNRSILRYSIWGIEAL